MRVLVIYDGDCRFCRWAIEWIRRWDARDRLAFCPFGHPLVERALSDLPPEVRYEYMHAVADGRRFSGTDAAELTLHQLPGGRLATRLRLHKMYPLIARYRGVLGRLTPDGPALVSCGEPDAQTTN